jgi:hypothetical protein
MTVGREGEAPSTTILTILGAGFHGLSISPEILCGDRSLKSMHFLSLFYVQCIELPILCMMYC